MRGVYFAGVFTRELESLRAEVAAYDDEAQLWALVPGITNSTGTLALHLPGNLQHFVGAKLGRSGYVRDRDAEFARRDVPRAELLAGIDQAINAVQSTLTTITDDVLDADFPDVGFGVVLNTEDFLLHLVSHLGYHLGQVNYHRRLVTGKGSGVNSLAIPRLATARSTAT